QNSQLNEPITLQVVPAAGGAPLQQKSSTTGAGGIELQSNQDVASLGSVADVEVPVSGAYVLSASFQQDTTGSRISFGTTTAKAVADKWKLLAALVGGAILLALIPIPRRRKEWEDLPESSWSTDARSPYAG